MALTLLDRALLGAYYRARKRPKLRRVLLRAMHLLHLVRGAMGAYEPGRYKARLAVALALSIALHALILSLQFGYAGFGLPSLTLPWAERRAHSWDLSVRLVARPVVPAPVPAPAKVEPRKPAEVEPVRPPTRALEVTARPKPAQPPPVEARAPVPKREPPKVAAAKRGPEAQVRRQPGPELIVQPDPQQETFSVPPPAPVETKPQAPEIAARAPAEEDLAAAREREQAVQKRAEEAARRAREQEAIERQRAREEAQEEARLQEEARKQQEAAREALALERQRAIEQEEARKQEEAKAAREALALEARQKAEEAARQQALALERQRALELEAQRQAEEVARQAARQRELEAKKQEEARKLEEAKRLDEARKLEEARRQVEEQAARARAQEAAERQKAEALAAAQREGQTPSRLAGGAIGGSADKPPAGVTGRDLAAKALEQLRTPGVVRPEPLRPRPLVESAEPSRRRSVFGSTDRDIGVRMYVDSWRWKVERNGNLNFPPAARKQAAESPVVTVAIRRDGSLEGVYINRSSGVRSLDEAVRRIVELYAPYSAFPPELARQYDVIEIRRVWMFSNTPNTLMLLEELPTQ